MKVEISLPGATEQQQLLFGHSDANLRLLRAEFNVKILTRGGLIHIEGADEQVDNVKRILNTLIGEIEGGAREVGKRLALLLELAQDTPESGIRTERGRIEPKTPGQRQYVQAVRGHGLTFATGPAGTGKTFLATACAVEGLRRGEVERLILTRPAVEAGESLGFLPGDMREKVDPYLRPIYDALGDMLGRRQLAGYIESGVIEVAPLAFMRGRTLNNAFVILDEAQNTTPVQMKMFLTRLGAKSRCVVTGDITQTDLANPAHCGLLNAMEILRGVPGVAQITLQKEDIVRHSLVAAIVHAYDVHAAREKGLPAPE